MNIPFSGFSRSSAAILAAGLASAMFVAACTKAPAAVSEDAAPPVKVQTAVATEIEAPLTLRTTGNLKGSRETDLAANAAGRVIKTNVERGAEVKQGMILAQLDTSAATLALAEAKVQVATTKTQQDISKADCARYEQLKAKGAVTDMEYDQVTAKCKTAPLTLEAAQARESIAAKNVGDGTIRAPFAGVIAERFVDVGEYVQPSSKVVSIAQVDELRLEFTVSEVYVSALKQDQTIQFRVGAYGDKEKFSGQVRYISGAVRVATRDIVAEAVVPNPDRRLKPGMFADVEIVTGNQKMAAVPLAAVFERVAKKRVYVVIDGHLQERVLQPGPEVNGALGVQSGVKVGEKVVVGNLDQLSNGARVE